MNPVILPSSTSSIPLPLSTLNISAAAKHSDPIEGSISSDGRCVWLWTGSLLEVQTAHTKLRRVPMIQHRIGVCDFGLVTKDSNCCITLVKEFCSPIYHQVQDGLKLLVVVQVMSSNILYLFNARSSRIIRAINLPFKATSIEVISTTGGATSENIALCHELRYLFGIIAVGMSDGSVALLDLALDEAESFVSNIKSPSEVVFIKDNLRELINLREAAIHTHRHLCVLIQRDENLNRQVMSDFYVSCIKYIGQTASLAIGYSNGTFQLWNGRKMAVDFFYSSEYTEPKPFTHFMYQEPENDPKNFCFLWAVQSPDMSSSQISSAILFSIMYKKKMWIHNYGILYEEFQAFNPRLEHFFTCDPYNVENSSTVASRIINCYTLNNNIIYSSSKGTDDSLRDDDGTGQEFGRCVFLWEAKLNNNNCETNCYFAIFDINQWYHAHMPTMIKLSQLEFCPFMSVYSLDDATKRIRSEMILDVQVDVKSIQKFVGCNSGEIHFYPLSLSFRATGLTDSNVHDLDYLGLQAKFLQMQLTWPKCLGSPSSLVSVCRSLELHPFGESSHSALQTEMDQREFLLTVALENNLTKFLINGYSKFAATEFVHSGGILMFMMDWAWKRVVHTKKTIDSMCIRLFDGSGLPLDAAAEKQLYSFVSHLKTLSYVFRNLKNNNSQHTDQAIKELDSFLVATEMIRLYLQVILWCYNVGLLPDNIEGEEFGENEIAYPASVFDKLYASRRNEIQMLSNTIQETDLLLIDGLLQNHENEIGALWDRERSGTSATSSNSSRLYPPPTFHSILSIYLVIGVDIQTKHDIFLYMLFDLAEYLQFKYSHIVERLKKFPNVFNMEASRVALIEAFWLLDQRMFEDAIVTLSNPLISVNDMYPWQHDRIIKSLLYQGECQKALKYRELREVALTTREDIKLHLSVLLSNGLVVEAFKFQRSARDDRNVEDLLKHLFLGCQQTKNVEKLLQLPLSTFEEEMLLKHLAECSDPLSQELLVMYYLQKGKILEARTLNEEMKMTSRSNDPKLAERAKTRTAIINGYLRLLPDIQQSIILGHNNNFQSTNDNSARIKVNHPVPLSAVIKPANGNIITQSSVVAAVMDKIMETYNDDNKVIPPVTPFRSWKKQMSIVNSESLPFVCTSSKFTKTDHKAVSSVVYPEASNAKDFDKGFGLSSPKKARHHAETSPFRLLDSIRRKSTKYVTDDFVSSVLTTPTILRKKPSFRRTLSHMTSSIDLPATPHSILKARSVLQSSEMPVRISKYSLLEEISASSALNPDDTNISISPGAPVSSSTSKQLRFDLSTVSEDRSLNISEKNLKDGSPATSKSPIGVGNIVTKGSGILFNFDTQSVEHDRNDRFQQISSPSHTPRDDSHEANVSQYSDAPSSFSEVKFEQQEAENLISSPSSDIGGEKLENIPQIGASDQQTKSNDLLQEEIDIGTTMPSSVSKSSDEYVESSLIAGKLKNVSPIKTCDDPGGNVSVHEETDFDTAADNSFVEVENVCEGDYELTDHLSLADVESSSPIFHSSAIESEGKPFDDVGRSLQSCSSMSEKADIPDEFKVDEITEQAEFVGPSKSEGKFDNRQNVEGKETKYTEDSIKETPAKRVITLPSKSPSGYTFLTEKPSSERRLSLRSATSHQKASPTSSVVKQERTQRPKRTPKKNDSAIGKAEDFPSFSFSEAIKKSPQVHNEELDLLTPEKSFIFSPPLTRSRAKKQLSNQSMMSSTHGSFLQDSLLTILEEDKPSIQQPTETPEFKDSAFEKRLTRLRKKILDDECASSLVANQSLLNFPPASPTSPKKFKKKAYPERSKYLFRTRWSARPN